MKITHVEYGETVSKDYQSKRLTLRAEIQGKETKESVLKELQKQVQDYLSERKSKAQRLRALAEQLDLGEIEVENIQDEF